MALVLSSVLFLVILTSACAEHILDSDNSTVTQNDVIPRNTVKDVSEFDLAEDLDLVKWEAPYEIQKNYPYYLAGFDYEDRPLWIVEMGKYDMLKITSRGSEWTDKFDKWVKQACDRIIKSHKFKNPDNAEADFIIDFEGLKLEQLANIRNMVYILKLARQYRKLLEDYTHLVVVINANYATQNLLQLVRPIFNRLFSVIEVYGTNINKWRPQLLKHFPKSAIPEWYGGSKNFTPIILHG